MCGQQLHLTGGRHPQLHARAAQLDAGDPLLDDAATLCQLREVGVQAEGRVLEAHRPQAVEHLGPLVRRAGCGKAGEVDDRVARTGHPLVELDDDGRTRAGRCGAQAQRRVDQLVERVQVLEADRVRERPPRRTAGGSRSSCRGRTAAGRRRTSGCPAPTRGRVPSAVVLYGTRCERVRSGMRSPIWRSSRGRSSSFWLSGRGEESLTETRVSRSRAWLGMTPGSSAR